MRASSTTPTASASRTMKMATKATKTTPQAPAKRNRLLTETRPHFCTMGLVSSVREPLLFTEMNDYQLTLVKIQDALIWHNHEDTDATFIVLEGVLRGDFRDGAARVSAGEMLIVPKG